MTLPYAIGPDYACFDRIDRKLTKQTLEYIMQPTMLEMVREFHEKHGILKDPKLKSAAIKSLRYDLIEEELQEFSDALFRGDKIEVADALGDLLYVVFGAAEVYGIDIERVFKEIHRSNMTKVSDGDQNVKIHKIRKGPNYSPPDLSFVLKT